MLLDRFLEIPFDAKSKADTAINRNETRWTNETRVEENKCVNM